MEIVVMTLMVVVCFNYILKQTYRKLPAILFSATVAALFTGLMWPFAIEQSKTQIQDWLANAELMKDTAVLLSVDVIIQLAFCMTAAHVMTSGKLKKNMIRAYKVLRWIPSILFYPVLFSGLTFLMFTVHGMEFKTLAWLMAAAVFVLIPALTWLLKYIIPEKDLRLEILFLCNVLILLLGIISTVNGQPAVAGTNKIDWTAFFGLIAIIAGGAAIGFFARQFFQKRKYEKLIRHNN